MRNVITAILASAVIGIPAIAEDVTVTRCEYWLDHDFDSRIELPVNADGEFSQSFDMSDKSAGLHSLGLRFCDSRGMWSVPVLRHFLKPHEERQVSSSLTGLRYWLDYDNEHPVTVGCPNGIVEMPLDVAALRPGLHALTYMAAESNGLYSPVVTRYFVIPHDAPEDGGAIAGYDYWFNYGKPVFVPIAAANVMELKDVTVEAVGVQPMAIPDDYTFDIGALTVTCPQSDVFFGMQPVNGTGGRSGAVLSDTVKMDLTVLPVFETVAGADALALDAPCGGKVAGVMLPTAPGDKLTVAVKGASVKADFYDGDGGRLSPVADREGDTRSYTFETQYGPMAYLLLHSASSPLEYVEVSVVEHEMSSVDAVSTGLTKIAAVPGGIEVEAIASGRLAVYDVAGTNVASCDVNAGKTIVPVSTGFYVVTVSDGTVARVVVR